MMHNTPSYQLLAKSGNKEDLDESKRLVVQQHSMDTNDEFLVSAREKEEF